MKPLFLRRNAGIAHSYTEPAFTVGLLLPHEKFRGGTPCLQQISAHTKKTMCWVVTRSSEWMVRDLLNKNKTPKGQNKKWTIKKYIGANT